MALSGASSLGSSVHLILTPSQMPWRFRWRTPAAVFTTFSEMARIGVTLTGAGMVPVEEPERQQTEWINIRRLRR